MKLNPSLSLFLVISLSVFSSSASKVIAMVDIKLASSVEYQHLANYAASDSQKTDQQKATGATPVISPSENTDGESTFQKRKAQLEQALGDYIDKYNEPKLIRDDLSPKGQEKARGQLCDKAQQLLEKVNKRISELTTKSEESHHFQSDNDMSVVFEHQQQPVAEFFNINKRTIPDYEVIAIVLEETLTVLQQKDLAYEKLRQAALKLRFITTRILQWEKALTTTKSKE